MRKFRETRPDLVLVLISENADVAAEAEAYGARFILKAISPAEFKAALKPVL